MWLDKFLPTRKISTVLCRGIQSIFKRNVTETKRKFGDLACFTKKFLLTNRFSADQLRRNFFNVFECASKSKHQYIYKHQQQQQLIYLIDCLSSIGQLIIHHNNNIVDGC